MIGDYFLDQCLVLVISLEDEEERTSEIIKNIFEILKWNKKESIDWGKEDNSFVEKLELVYTIAHYRNSVKKFNFDEFIDRLSSGKFSHLLDHIRNRKIELTKEDIDAIVKKLRTKRKVCELLTGKKSIQNTLNDIDSGNFIDEEQIINQWESEVNKLHSNIMKVSILESRDKAVRLNLLDDDYSPVLSILRESLDETKTVRTGYKCIDNMLPAKGLEDRRLYLIGGSSGVGKSVFLINLIVNGLLTKIPIVNDNEYDYCLYITAENLIDESLLRLYCCLTGKPYYEVSNKLLNDKSFSLKPELADAQIKHKMKIEFYYVEPGKTTVSDIENLVRIVYEKSNKRLKIVILDYLDIISCDDYDSVSDKRIAQGEISRGFKNIAVTYNVPFVTATQLNRSGYDTKLEPSLTQMGESMLKINNSDFVLFLQNSIDSSICIDTIGGKREYNRVRMTILKNRNGSVGGTVYLGMPVRLSGSEMFNYRFEELPRILDCNTVDDESTDYSDFQ